LSLVEVDEYETLLLTRAMRMLLSFAVQTVGHVFVRRCACFLMLQEQQQQQQRQQSS
jgi:hypothetical protein